MCLVNGVRLGQKPFVAVVDQTIDFVHGRSPESWPLPCWCGSLVGFDISIDQSHGSASVSKAHCLRHDVVWMPLETMPLAPKIFVFTVQMSPHKVYSVNSVPPSDMSYKWLRACRACHLGRFPILHPPERAHPHLAEAPAFVVLGREPIANRPKQRKEEDGGRRNQRRNHGEDGEAPAHGLKVLIGGELLGAQPDLHRGEHNDNVTQYRRQRGKVVSEEVTIDCVARDARVAAEDIAHAEALIYFIKNYSALSRNALIRSCDSLISCD